jgi:hypothetical protein
MIFPLFLLYLVNDITLAEGFSSSPTSDYQEGWPKTINGTQNVWIGILSPVIADLDGDHMKELVVTIQGNPEGHLSTLFIIEENGQIRADVSLDCYFDPRAFPSVADINGDGVKEIIAYCSQNSQRALKIFDSKGTLLKELPIDYLLSDDLYGSIVLEDINNDGSLEFIYGGWDANGSWLVVLYNNGNMFPGFPVMLENVQTSTIMTPAVGNLDDDNDKEIVVISWRSSESSNIKAFNVNGSEIFSQRIDSRAYTDPVLGDINNDGYDEITFTSESGVFVLDRNGNFLLNKKMGENRRHSNMALADLNGDDDLELMFGYGMSMYAIHLNGTEIFSYLTDWYTHHPPIVGDVNGDGSLDIIFNSDNDIYALDRFGNILPGFPELMGTIAYSSPSIDDIDNDGDIELISSSTWLEPDIGVGIIYVWDLNGTYNPAKIEWPMFQHDAGHTGAYRKDSDGDGISDIEDNCIYVYNPNQKDTNSDGYGLVCDPDVDNDGNTIENDAKICSDAYGTHPGDPKWNPDCDLNGDEIIDIKDLFIINDNIGMPPGPSYGSNVDGDGWIDERDNCWYVKNSNQLDSNGNCPSMPFTTDPKCGDVCEDVTPPVITILSPRNTVYYTTSIPLIFTVNEQTSWCVYSLDGKSNVTLPGCAGTTLFGLSYSSHNIIVYANDTSGNMGASSRVYFTVMKSGGGGCGGPLPLNGCRME